MYSKTLDGFAEIAATKSAYSRDQPVAFLISSMLAGAYVGIGIILIFTLGQQIDPSLRSLVMGACFGIALTLVIFAGSDLFTGHTLFMTVGLARGSSDFAALLRNWALSWVGNLVGSALLAFVFFLAGGGQVLKEGADLVYTASAAKMSAPAIALMARAALCNWLVCLAIWMSARDLGCGEMHPHLVVPLRLHRLRLRAFGRQYDGVLARPSRQPSAERHARRRGL